MDVLPAEFEVFWEAFATMTLKPGIPESIEKRYLLPVKPEKSLDATDLTKPCTKRFKTWMDHQMVLLMDQASEPGELDIDPQGSLCLLMRGNEQSLWVTSQTEWDVTLEFVVRASMPRTRKVWWQREAEAPISIPSGKLHVEQTAGGPLMEIELPAGDYRVIARGSCPPDADASQEGVEKIQIILVPAVEIKA